MSWPVFWNGQQVGSVVELSADMYWWHARWQPGVGEPVRAFLAAVEAGDDPIVVLGTGPERRFVVTAATEHELELKAATER